MVTDVLTQNRIPQGLDVDGLEKAFEAHVEAVKAAIPSAERLVFEANDGWDPLCAFPGVLVPDGSYPKTNDRAEFLGAYEGLACKDAVLSCTIDQTVNSFADQQAAFT